MWGGTQASGIYRRKQKTPWNGLEKFPVEKRMNSEAAVHEKPLTQLPDSFDSPVIYGVRVETSKPYYLLISKLYSETDSRLDVRILTVI